MSDKIKYLHSGMQGAPVVSNGFGDLVGMLEACLVTGFNLKAVDSITRTGSVATLTTASAHGYEVGQWVTIAGAVQSEYNGEQQIVSVTTTAATFAVAGTPATPATGTITAKVTPLGFETAFTDTDKRVFRSPNSLGTRPFIRVDGSQLAGYGATWAKFCRVTIAEGMSDIDTFVGARAPYDPASPLKNETKTTVNGTNYYGWHRWFSACQAGGNYASGDGGSTKVHAWRVIGDDRGFYLFIDPWADVGRGYSFYSAGEFTSYKAGDAFNAQLVAHSSYENYFGYFGSQLEAGQYNQISVGVSDLNQPRVLLRDFTGVGYPIGGMLATLNMNGGFTSGVGITPFPNGPDYSVLLFPSYLYQKNYHLRGTLPGQYAILNGSSPYTDGVVLNNVVGYPDKRFLIVAFNYNSDNLGRIAFDITGPWER